MLGSGGKFARTKDGAPIYDLKADVEKENQNSNDERKNGDDSVRIELFKKKIWWVYIAVAVSLLVALLIFIYVTTSRHDRNKKRLLTEVKQRCNVEAPQCGFDIDLKSIKKRRADANNSAAISTDTLFDTKTLEEMNKFFIYYPPSKRFKMLQNMYPDKSDDSGGIDLHLITIPAVKPRAEWNEDAGLAWIRRLNAMKRDEDYLSAKRISVRRNAAGQLNLRSIFLSSIGKYLKLEEKQNWTTQGGVQDIFDINAKCKRCVMFGATNECDIAEDFAGVNLQFEADFSMALKRKDHLYDAETWWGSD